MGLPLVTKSDVKGKKICGFSGKEKINSVYYYVNGRTTDTMAIWLVQLTTVVKKRSAFCSNIILIVYDNKPVLYLLLQVYGISTHSIMPFCL